MAGAIADVVLAASSRPAVSAAEVVTLCRLSGPTFITDRAACVTVGNDRGGPRDRVAYDGRTVVAGE
jgi:hypothetical protein